MTDFDTGREFFAHRLQIWRWDTERPPLTEPMSAAEAEFHGYSDDERAEYNAHFDAADNIAAHARKAALVAYCDLLLAAEAEREAAVARAARYETALRRAANELEAEGNSHRCRFLHDEADMARAALVESPDPKGADGD